MPTNKPRLDCAAMRIKVYEELIGRIELYSRIQEGMDDIALGNTRLFSEAMSEVRSQRR